MEKIRFCELIEGDVFILSGRKCTVKKIEGGRTFFYCFNGLKDLGSKNQQYVELVNERDEPIKIYPKTPVTVGDVRPESNYTNISGHLKTIEKYSK